MIALEAAASDIHEDNDGRDTHISGEKPAEDEDFTMGGDYFQDLDYRETGRKSRGNRKRFSTSLSISNLTGSRQAYGGYGTIQPAALSFNGIPVKNAISAIPGNGILLLNSSSLGILTGEEVLLSTPDRSTSGSANP